MSGLDNQEGWYKIEGNGEFIETTLELILDRSGNYILTSEDGRVTIKIPVIGAQNIASSITYTNSTLFHPSHGYGPSQGVD